MNKSAQKSKSSKRASLRKSKPSEPVSAPIDSLYGEISPFLAKLTSAAREGHLCLPHEPEADQIPKELIGSLVCREGDLWYLKRYWEAEKRFQEHWERVRSAEPTIALPALTLQAIEPEQAAAITAASQQCLTLICGGPGTGKSFTAAKLVEAFAPHMSVAVAAPTGKAAANLKGAMGRPAETLHALLRQKRLPHDLIVVDEGSMIDAGIMARLFAAVKTGARLVLLGDAEQLPPVEAGGLFVDLTCHENVCHLTRCLRTELQEIVSMAEAVKRGEMIPTKPLPSLKELVKLEGTILTPLRRGPYGADALNRRCAAARTGAVPILITVNDRKLGLFNGDVGTLEGECAHFSEGREIPKSLLPAYEYAYVLSVHKSQGSEYDEVSILLPPGSERFGREMLYTAITRGRKKVDVYGDPSVVEAIVGKKTPRLSGLGVGLVEHPVTDNPESGR